jgi:hypothetical protein
MADSVSLLDGSVHIEVRHGNIAHSTDLHVEGFRFDDGSHLLRVVSGSEGTLKGDLLAARRVDAESLPPARRRRGIVPHERTR